MPVHDPKFITYFRQRKKVVLSTALALPVRVSVVLGVGADRAYLDVAHEYRVELFASRPVPTVTPFVARSFFIITHFPKMLQKPVRGENSGCQDCVRVTKRRSERSRRVVRVRIVPWVPICQHSEGVSTVREQAKERKSGAREPKKQCFARESRLSDTHTISPNYY